MASITRFVIILLPFESLPTKDSEYVATNLVLNRISQVPTEQVESKSAESSEFINP